MQSVWDSGFFQTGMSDSHIDVSHIVVIFIMSIALSQLISNVPLVTIYLPLLMSHNHSSITLLSLAAGSTIAGNLSILGQQVTLLLFKIVKNVVSEVLDFWSLYLWEPHLPYLIY
ncbi:NaH antiporter NhaD [Legionella pneumophila]|nr:NaH antiporter NhaD [Legionella pneumophila]